MSGQSKQNKSKSKDAVEVRWKLSSKAYANVLRQQKKFSKDTGGFKAQDGIASQLLENAEL
jgi:hypothetical protein